MVGTGLKGRRASLCAVIYHVRQGDRNRGTETGDRDMRRETGERESELKRERGSGRERKRDGEIER